jgi:hypothetical protein
MPIAIIKELFVLWSSAGSEPINSVSDNEHEKDNRDKVATPLFSKSFLKPSAATTLSPASASPSHRRRDQTHRCSHPRQGYRNSSPECVRGTEQVVKGSPHHKRAESHQSCPDRRSRRASFSRDSRAIPIAAMSPAKPGGYTGRKSSDVRQGAG